jgi:hypothetical protein
MKQFVDMPAQAAGARACVGVVAWRSRGDVDEAFARRARVRAPAIMTRAQIPPPLTLGPLRARGR